MVLAERNTENIRNGRRSRGPSPNGHGGTNESSSDDDSGRKIGNAKTKTKSDYEEKIRVGRDYQVVCPELIPPPERKPEILPDKALLVWSPTKDIPDTQLEEYITVAKEKYGYNGEQALGMLFWHKHDLERAVLDLANFTPFPDEWTVEDKVLFEQAFQFHGKRFHQIRQMLPDKSIASLVKFYYSWKKTRSRTSVMDRQDKKKAEGSENGSENGSNEESDNEDKDGSSVQNGQINGIVNKNANEKTPPTISSASSETSCSSCGVACHHVYKISNIGRLCGSCHTHWQRTGNLRPTSGPMASKRSRHMDEKHTRKPPRGIHINHDDIVALACPEQCDQTNGSGDLLAGMDRGLVSVLSQMQQNKQSKSTLLQSSTDLKITQVESFNRTSRWNNEELLLGVQGVKKFGKDFLAIADTIATKTEAQVRTFFVNYRRRYNLDIMLAEYEAANNSQAKIRTPSTDAPVVMEIDLVNDDDTNTKETVSIS